MVAHDISPWDAIGILTPLIGSAGISGILIAIFGYLAAARTGRRGEPEKAAALSGIIGGIVESNRFDDYVKAADKLAIAIDKHADALNRQHEIRQTNALERLAEKVDEVLDRERHRRNFERNG